MYSKKWALCPEEARKHIAMEEKFVTLTDDELVEVVGGENAPTIMNYISPNLGTGGCGGVLFQDHK